MTLRITIRLPENIVEFVDQQVASGSAPSRAAVITQAVEHERRRQTAGQDARTHAADQRGEFDDLAAWSTTQSMDVD